MKKENTNSDLMNRKLYLSSLAGSELKEYLKSCGYELCLLYENGRVSKAISTHPDIFMCALKDGIYFGDSSLLEASYPGDVLYNAAAVGKYLVCNRYTSQDLIRSSGLTPVYVNQGYVKCNLVVLDDTHVITEDEGIAKTLGQLTDIDCLLIKPRQVRLEGYDCGFIGGASGRIEDTIVFNGDLSAHSDYEIICRFISKCNLQIKYFDTYPLTDIGSIISVKS